MDYWEKYSPAPSFQHLSDMLFPGQNGKSLAEPYRISIKRFTARVPEMPKYNTGDGFGMLNMYAEHRESNGWGTLLPGLKTEASAAPTPRSDL